MSEKYFEISRLNKYLNQLNEIKERYAERLKDENLDDEIQAYFRGNIHALEEVLKGFNY